MEVKLAIGILVSHATRYLCHQRLAFCIAAQPIIASIIGKIFVQRFLNMASHLS
jgi:hypothetical protein